MWLIWCHLSNLQIGFVSCHLEGYFIQIPLLYPFLAFKGRVAPPFFSARWSEVTKSEQFKFLVGTGLVNKSAAQNLLLIILLSCRGQVSKCINKFRGLVFELNYVIKRQFCTVELKHIHKFHLGCKSGHLKQYFLQIPLSYPFYGQRCYRHSLERGEL